MRRRALALCLLAARALSQPPACTTNTSFTCFADAPTRPVSYLAIPASKTLSLATCADACIVNGFTVAALTSNPSAAYCYCGASIAHSSTPAPTSACALPCPGDAAHSCGAEGFSAVYPIACAGPLPPTPSGPDLAPGRACSQPEVRGLPFCDTTLPRAARVADLVARLTLPEIASQLQARSSDAIPRVGLPPFYCRDRAQLFERIRR